jgi:hypothetical protein
MVSTIMDMRLIGLALVLVCNGWSQTDSRLEALHQTLQSLHAQVGVSAVNSGEGPKLTLAKHQLRDWIESQLRPLEDEWDETKTSERINKALEKVTVAPSKDDQNLLGSLGDVEIRWESGLLIVITRLGIVCGEDESAYAYKRIDGKWHPMWESEQNDYHNYTPQHINAVHVWQSFEGGKPTGPAYILTLGNEWGCASAWHRVYYLIWRVDSSGSKSLVDQSGDGYLRGRNYIVGSIVNSPMHFSGPVDAIIEFTQASIDGAVHNREAVRHFLIEGDRVRRVAPVALGPMDFVDEWMTRPWNESRGWSLSPDLSVWHQKLHADFVGGTFIGDTRHCQTPDLWQVGFEPQDAKRNFEPEPKVYFLIRWTPPYTFALVGISSNPSPRCTQADREPGTSSESYTSIPTARWRPAGSQSIRGSGENKNVFGTERQGRPRVVDDNVNYLAAASPSGRVAPRMANDARIPLFGSELRRGGEEPWLPRALPPSKMENATPRRSRNQVVSTRE